MYLLHSTNNPNEQIVLLSVPFFPSLVFYK